MKRFCKKLVFFSLIMILILYGIMFIQKDSIWKVTNSISMDAKLWYAKKTKATNLDVVGIGSSMTLNNLNTKAVLAVLPEERFFNYGAWGLQIEDTRIILENILQTSTPKTIILFSNIVDFFDNQESRYQDADLRNYMDRYWWNDLVISMKYAYPHNLETIKTYEAYKKQNNNYTSLDFDLQGGVALEVYGENIDSGRWNTVLEKDCVKEEQYKALESLCELAKNKGVTLYFVQTPFREHYLSEVGTKEMEEHQRKCRMIVEASGQYYWMTEDYEKYDDSLFADYIHLNKEGSQLFTEEFMKYYISCEEDRDNNL